MLVEAHLHGVRDRMLALRSLPNYADLRDDSLLYIAEHARERRFRPGDVLLEEGQAVERIYIVIGGKVTIRRNGKVFMVIEGRGGVGVLSALAHDPDGWAAVADADTTTLEIPATAFLANLEEDYALLRNSLRILSMRALESRGNLPMRPERAPPLAELGVYPDREFTLVERILALRAKGSPFANVNMDAIIEICRRMTTMRVESGHSFFEVGEPSSHSMRVIYGHVRCTAGDAHVDVGETMVLGALDAFSGRPRSYAAHALTKVVAYRTPIEEFLAVIEMHPNVGMTLCKNIASQLIAR